MNSRCSADSQLEQVWLVVPERSGPLCIDTRGSEFDTVLSVMTDCADPASEIDCDDDSVAVLGPSELQVEAEAERPLFIVVDGF